jgi:hypothetical protein
MILRVKIKFTSLIQINTLSGRVAHDSDLLAIVPQVLQDFETFCYAEFAVMASSLNVSCGELVF